MDIEKSIWIPNAKTESFLSWSVVIQKTIRLLLGSLVLQSGVEVPMFSNGACNVDERWYHYDEGGMRCGVIELMQYVFEMMWDGM